MEANLNLGSEISSEKQNQSSGPALPLTNMGQTLRARVKLKVNVPSPSDPGDYRTSCPYEQSRTVDNGRNLL